MVEIRDQECINLALFHFFQRRRTQESPRAVTSTSFVSGHVLFCCLILVFPSFFFISFQIFFVCLSFCLSNGGDANVNQRFL